MYVVYVFVRKAFAQEIESALNFSRVNDLYIRSVIQGHKLGPEDCTRSAVHPLQFGPGRECPANPFAGGSVKNWVPHEVASSSVTSLPGHFRWAYGFLPRVRFGFCAIGSFSPSCLPKGSYCMSLRRHSVIGIELRLTISSVVLG